MADIKPINTNTARSDVIGETAEVKVPLSEHELELEQALQNYEPNSDAEKRLVRKLDMFMMPTLWFMYILAYIDRQNIVSLLASANVSPTLRILLLTVTSREMQESPVWETTWASLTLVHLLSFTIGYQGEQPTNYSNRIRHASLHLLYRLPHMRSALQPHPHQVPSIILSSRLDDRLGHHMLLYVCRPEL